MKTWYGSLMACFVSMALVSRVVLGGPPPFDDGQARPVTRTFQLKEFLGHSYSDELVSFPVAFSAGECRTASLRLLDDAGKTLPYQLSDVQESNPGGMLRSAKVWFWVDRLPAQGQRSYTLHGSNDGRCKPPSWAKSPITWTSLAGQTVEVSNGVFSLHLAGNAAFPSPQRASEVGGPLRRFKGADGVWRGTGELQVESPVLGQSLRVTDQGPLWATFVARLEFVSPPGSGGTGAGPYYEMSVTMYPGRDFCRIREKSDFPLRLEPMPRDCTGISGNLKRSENWRTLPCPADNFLLMCNPGWKADHLYTQSTWVKNLLDIELLPNQFRCFTALRPALPMMDAGFFSVYSSKGRDLLGLVGVDASHWQYPDNSAHPTAGTPGRNTEPMFLNEPGKGATSGCRWRAWSATGCW